MSFKWYFIQINTHTITTHAPYALLDFKVPNNSEALNSNHLLQTIGHSVISSWKTLSSQAMDRVINLGAKSKQSTGWVGVEYFVWPWRQCFEFTMEIMVPKSTGEILYLNSCVSWGNMKILTRTITKMPVNQKIVIKKLQLKRRQNNLIISSNIWPTYLLNKQDHSSATAILRQQLFHSNR